MTTYEWCYEEVADGDVIDNYFSDKLADLNNSITDTLCLVVREGNETDGEYFRAWAYVDNGRLPEYFSDEMGNRLSYKIPQSFHKELLKHNFNRI